METIKKGLFDKPNLSKCAIELASYDYKNLTVAQADNSEQVSLSTASVNKHIQKKITKLIRDHLFLIYLNAIELFYILNK
jgi:uncharacterized protein YajQ (UPF0234 family)